jgi:hypothetical protein
MFSGFVAKVILLYLAELRQMSQKRFKEEVEAIFATGQQQERYNLAFPVTKAMAVSVAKQGANMRFLIFIY